MKYTSSGDASGEKGPFEKFTKSDLRALDLHLHDSREKYGGDSLLFLRNGVMVLSFNALTCNDENNWIQTIKNVPFQAVCTEKNVFLLQFCPASKPSTCDISTYQGSRVSCKHLDDILDCIKEKCKWAPERFKLVAVETVVQKVMDFHKKLKNKLTSEVDKIVEGASDSRELCKHTHQELFTLSSTVEKLYNQVSKNLDVCVKAHNKISGKIDKTQKGESSEKMDLEKRFIGDLRNDFKELKAEIDVLKQSLQDVRQYMDLNALAISNKLLIGNLQLSLTSIFISIAAYFTGVFGMNLDQVDGLSYGDIQTGEGSFIIVFVCSFTIVVIGFVVAYYYKCKLDQMLPKALT